MKIYISDKNIDSFIYPILKRGDKVTSSCPAASFNMSHFYIKTGFTIKFLLPGCKSLPHIFILDLLSGMFLTLIVLILFT